MMVYILRERTATAIAESGNKTPGMKTKGPLLNCPFRHKTPRRRRHTGEISGISEGMLTIFSMDCRLRAGPRVEIFLWCMDPIGSLGNYPGRGEPQLKPNE